MNADKRHLYIEKLVFGGSGLGFFQGKAVFVPFTAPGDDIVWEPVIEKRHFFKGRLLSVEGSGNGRIPPSCPHFMRCGGCHWQHLSLETQLVWKYEIFSSIISGKCDVTREKIFPAHPSPTQWNYRSRARIQVRFSGERVIAGFYMAESHRVCHIEKCQLLDPRLNTLVSLIQKHLAARKFSKHGNGLEVLLEAGDEGGVRIVFVPPRKTVRSRRHGKAFLEDSLFVDSCMALASDSPFPVSIFLQLKGAATLISHNSKTPQPVVIRPEGAEGVTLNLPPGGFSQVNLEQNRTLAALVKEAVRQISSGKSKVIDLFCGMGNFTLPLAPLCSEIKGVDSASHLIHAAQENCLINKIENASFCAEPVEKFVERKGSLAGYDIALMDPPRAGAYEAAEAICRDQVPAVIYVSCDPMTLARDLMPMLEAGYEVCWSRPVDLFPQTYHIESVTLLRIKGHH